jgi:hypothetical protein
MPASARFGPMNATRPHLPLLAQALLMLVLLNGMLCSMGHGQMMGAPLEPSSPSHRGHAMVMDHKVMESMHTAPDGQGSSLPAMKSPFDNCFFAGSLPLALLAYVALGWLLRHRACCPAAYSPAPRASLRALLPALRPRAP